MRKRGRNWPGVRSPGCAPVTSARVSRSAVGALRPARPDLVQHLGLDQDRARGRARRCWARACASRSPACCCSASPPRGGGPLRTDRLLARVLGAAAVRVLPTASSTGASSTPVGAGRGAVRRPAALHGAARRRSCSPTSRCARGSCRRRGRARRACARVRREPRARRPGPGRARRAGGRLAPLGAARRQRRASSCAAGGWTRSCSTAGGCSWAALCCWPCRRGRGLGRRGVGRAGAGLDRLPRGLRLRRGRS